MISIIKGGEKLENRASGYKTRQRDLILDVLKKHGSGHLTVEDVTKLLNDNSTAVGKSTVYRYLEKLAEEGIVKKYTVDGERSVCYQYLDSHKACSNHYHMKCEKCGKLIHMECETVDKLTEHIFTHHNFRLNGSKCVFYGICDDCYKGE
ncbi:MAG: transcriptional repressor [Clostridia bacterium]|nr:transcriptional repressor [Clostridia bacterium]